MSQAESSSSNQATATATSEEDWSSVTDPNERRRIQNRIAQRRFREKVKQQREDAERTADNQRQAAAAYTSPEPQQMPNRGESGLPWGSIPLRHIVETGKAKEKSSRETSIQEATSRAGSSSRLGLLLIDQYARGSPAWAAWRERIIPYTRVQDQVAPQYARLQSQQYNIISGQGDGPGGPVPL